MRIPKGHAELAVAEELLDLLETPTLHDEPARAGVPEVVEAKVVDLGLSARPFKRGADAPHARAPLRLQNTSPVGSAGFSPGGGLGRAARASA